jgi:hypothetical protein
MVNHIFPVLLVQMYQRLGIAVGLKPMSHCSESFTEFGIIVNFAIKGRPDTLVLIGERLSATFDINDAQADVSQNDVIIAEDTLAIGAAMPQDINHILYDPAVELVYIKIDYASNTTHSI